MELNNYSPSIPGYIPFKHQVETGNFSIENRKSKLPPIGRMLKKNEFVIARPAPAHPKRGGIQSTLQSPNKDVPTHVPGNMLDQNLSDLQNTLQAEATP